MSHYRHTDNHHIYANIIPAQQSCRDCAGILYPQFDASNLLFAVGLDHGQSISETGKRGGMYYVAVFAKVTDGARTTRKLLERGPMASHPADAWGYLEGRMTRAIDKLVQEVEKKANLATRDRECRIVFAAYNTEAGATHDVPKPEPAPPAYSEAESAGYSLPSSSKQSAS